MNQRIRQIFVLAAFVVYSAVIHVSPIVSAQPEHAEPAVLSELVSLTPDHQDHAMASSAWEGSSAGIAYSERNHHIAGLFVLLMGLAELSHAFRMASLGWTRWLLPLALVCIGFFLTIWSDHEAWPIGALSFTQTLFGQDHEIVQHKLYGLLAMAVGTIEWVRRMGRMGHAAWATPLPLMAIVGGLMLFGHSHGSHPSAHKITLHHTVMGTMALTAGSFKLLSDWSRDTSKAQRLRWDVLWAGLILLIGAQLFLYAE